ncbi:hypothetical protein GGR56DRAFT_629382 [Xylariaceae sp. FL0804]|nr:hypothetical protein GGR56DRAFT_629382 [Xylariaceae sp. FL0804]
MPVIICNCSFLLTYCVCVWGRCPCRAALLPSVGRGLARAARVYRYFLVRARAEKEKPGSLPAGSTPALAGLVPI